jgi:hypothetical protein
MIRLMNFRRVPTAVAAGTEALEVERERLAAVARLLGSPRWRIGARAAAWARFLRNVSYDKTAGADPDNSAIAQLRNAATSGRRKLSGRATSQ